MQIHPDHIKAIEKLIPKKDQQAFLDQVIEEALQDHLKKATPHPLPDSGKPSNPSDTLEVFTDGGSRGNPGPSGGGFAVYQKGKLVLQGSESFGRQTNNQAEYLALRLALREVYSKFGDAKIRCFMDSQLVVEQLSGRYKVKSENVKSLHEEIKRLSEQFQGFEISHIPREQNQVADRLANEAMDER